MQSLQGPSLPNYGATPVQYIYLREDSSSATASDLIGPSRILGKVFSFLGAKLERHINLAADRLGYGPLALRRKLTTTKYHTPSLKWTIVEMTAKQRERVVKKLMRYVSSGTFLTQSQALELICDLVIEDLKIRNEFVDAGLHTELQDLWIYCNMARKQYQHLACRDPDIDFLLASSRKALIFVEENEVNTVAKPFLNLISREIRSKPHPDRLAMLSPLLHAYTVLIRRSYGKETRNTPIGTLAYAYYTKMDFVPWYILDSFYKRDLRSEFLDTPLPAERIELCIRAYFLLFSHFIRTDRTVVRQCVFKLLTEERKMRYYSVVQRNFADYNLNGAQEPDIWDDIPLPTLPHCVELELELLSVTKVPIDLSKLDELRFPLPAALDRAILYDASFKSTGGYLIGDFLTVWEISSESEL